VTRRIRRSIVVPLSTLAIAAPSVSFAHAACPPQDVVCLGEETAGTGGSVVDETIAPVTDTAEPVLGDIQDRLDDLLGGAGVDPPDPIGGGGGGSHSPSQVSRGTSSHAAGHGGAAGGRIPGGPRLNGAAGTGHALSTPSGAVVRDPDPASRDRSDTVLGGVARSLAIVLALFGLAVGFVAIQDRFDRNDPRLALAPVESDIVEFA